MPSQIRVVIVNYYSATLLEKCVLSFPNNNSLEFYIFNNGDTADGDHIIQGLSLKPNIQVLWSQHNIGFGAGVNRIIGGLPEEDTPVVIINPDCEVMSLDLSQLQSLDLERKIYSPLILSGQRDAKSYVWFNGGNINQEDYSVRHNDYGKLATETKGLKDNYTFQTGACFVTSKHAFELVGGFDESLFLYFEDVDFSLAAKNSGATFQIISSFVIWHKEGGSNTGKSQKSKNYYFYMNRNRILVAYKYRKGNSLVSSKFILETFKLLARTRHEPLRFIPAAIYFSFKGMFEGFSGKTEGINSENNH